MIISCLHDDPKALKNCALTSKVFLPATRCYLFASVTLKPYRELDIDLDSLHSVSPFVRSLTLNWDSEESDDFDIIPFIARRQNHNDVSIFKSLTSIKHFCFTTYRYKAQFHPNRTHNDVLCSLIVPGGETTITELKLELCCLPSIDYFTYVISSLAALRALFVHHVWLEDEDYDKVDTPPAHELSSPHLRTLGAFGVDHNILLRWIVSQPTIPALETVVIEVKGDTFPGVVTFLSIVGRSVKYLTMRVNSWSFPCA
jgi:hypothetical protein